MVLSYVHTKPSSAKHPFVNPSDISHTNCARSPPPPPSPRAASAPASGYLRHPAPPPATSICILRITLAQSGRPSSDYSSKARENAECNSASPGNRALNVHGEAAGPVNNLHPLPVREQIARCGFLGQGNIQHNGALSALCDNKLDIVQEHAAESGKRHDIGYRLALTEPNYSRGVYARARILHGNSETCTACICRTTVQYSMLHGSRQRTIATSEYKTAKCRVGGRVNGCYSVDRSSLQRYT